MGREGRRCCHDRVEGGPPAPSDFSLFLLCLWLDAVPLASREQVPVRASGVPPAPRLPSSRRALLPGGQGRGQSECMRLSEDRAGKAQARGRYRRGAGGRWKPSPAGCTDLHGKSRMTSQLRKLAWGGKGGASSGYVVKGLEGGSRGPQVGVRATYGEAWER